MRQELAQLSGTASCAEAADPAPPQHLFYLADAAGLDAAVRTEALRAVDWRCGYAEPLVRYGVELVEAVLAAREATTTDRLREQFRRATLQNFNPRGTHFDGFIVRLFEGAGVPEPDFPGYALGLSVARLPLRRGASEPEARMRLLPAIYSRERQLAIVETLYQSYEDYFLSAVQRFGERDLNDLLTPCWDKFRSAIGAVLMRFRSPASCREREWIALALARPHQLDQRVVFEIIGNRLLPCVALDIAGPPGRDRRRPPFELIAIGAALPFESTRDALSAFLAHNRAHGVRIVPAHAIDQRIPVAAD